MQKQFAITSQSKKKTLHQGNITEMQMSLNCIRKYFLLFSMYTYTEWTILIYPFSKSQNKFKAKIFQTKILWFQEGKKLMTLVDLEKMSLRLGQGYLKFFKWNPSFFITHTYCCLRNSLHILTI